MSLRWNLRYRWHNFIPNDLVLRKAGLRQVTYIVRERLLRLCRCNAAPRTGSRPQNPVLFGSVDQDHVEGPPRCFVVASGWVLSEEYDLGGPAICLRDGQTEAKEVLSQCGRACGKRMPTCCWWKGPSKRLSFCPVPDRVNKLQSFRISKSPVLKPTLHRNFDYRII